MRHLHTLAFTTSALLFGALTPSAVRAYDRSQHATYCYPADAASPNLVPAARGLENAGNAAAELFCPVGDDFPLPNTNVVQMRVYGYDANPAAEIRAQACESNQFTDGGVCDAAVLSGLGFVGNYNLNLPHPAWAAPDIFIYLHVELPPVTVGGARSTLRGYLSTDY